MKINSGIIGFLVLIASLFVGYNEYHYFVSISILSVMGSIVYYLKSPINNLIIFAQDSYLKLFLWVIWVFIAQGITWSFFYWLGSLFN